MNSSNKIRKKRGFFPEITWVYLQNSLLLQTNTPAFDEKIGRNFEFLRQELDEKWREIRENPSILAGKRKRFLLFRAFSVYFLQKSEINQRGDIKLTTKYLRVKNAILTPSKRSYFQTHRTQVRNMPVLKGFHWHFDNLNKLSLFIFLECIFLDA